MAEKATPRPWRHDNKWPTAVWAGAEWVASTNVRAPRDFDESAANARLIVQAVNSHDALVDALGAASDELEHVIRAHGLNLDPDVLEQIYAALALAKKGAK